MAWFREIIDDYLALTLRGNSICYGLFFLIYYQFLEDDISEQEMKFLVAKHLIKP